VLLLLLLISARGSFAAAPQAVQRYLGILQVTDQQQQW